jgi:hypothetical protein
MGIFGGRRRFTEGETCRYSLRLCNLDVLGSSNGHHRPDQRASPHATEQQQIRDVAPSLTNADASEEPRLVATAYELLAEHLERLMESIESKRHQRLDWPRDELT